MTDAPASETAEPAVEADNPHAKLVELGVDGDIAVKIIELGVESIDDLKRLTEVDLISAGMKPIPARGLLDKLAPVLTADAAVLGAPALDFLPTVPDDSSWLEALKMGGVLKVDPSTVISTVRAALADRVHLFDVPKRLVEEMEKFAETSEEPVDAEFYRLRTQIIRRSYAEIFEAIEGLDGSFVTDARRKQLIERMNERFWPAISNFYNQLRSWQEAWMQGAASPGILLMALASGTAGLGTMPPGMMQPPETGAVRDQADELNNAINRVFAGTLGPVAAALAYDATQIRKTLENPRLPGLVGAANKDQMLKQLGVAVSASYPRLETNLSRFVLGALQLKDVPAGNEELQYLAQLFSLGTQIQWDQLKGSVAKVTGIGSLPSSQL